MRQGMATRSHARSRYDESTPPYPLLDPTPMMYFKIAYYAYYITFTKRFLF